MERLTFAGPTPLGPFELEVEGIGVFRNHVVR
jgi:hypothetical protein